MLLLKSMMDTSLSLFNLWFPAVISSSMLWPPRTIATFLEPEYMSVPVPDIARINGADVFISWITSPRAGGTL
jgi:hypothetical protein